ncbi:MAG: DUF362 domain-containing protein, partial [Candidatus Kariarchaeaceae archaeon]
ERILLKTHFGKRGALAHFRPAIISAIVEAVKEKGALPTLAETAGIGYGLKGPYSGRSTASDYLTMANSHGFSIGTMNAPIILLDGELGADTFAVSISGESISKVHVARGVLHFDKVVVLTHAKGHQGAGIGGTLKNLGIGMVGKESKANAHLIEKVMIDQEKCLGEECAKCIIVCPTRCIILSEGEAKIIEEECIKCMHCRSVCEEKAIITETLNDPLEFNRRFVENAKGVIQAIGKERMFYLNFVIDLSPACDCVNHTPYFMAQDIGILASQDPVAIDQAAVDLINEADVPAGIPISSLQKGEDKIAHAHGKMNEAGEFILSENYKEQLAHAEKIGLGNRKYELVRL